MFFGFKIIDHAFPKVCWTYQVIHKHAKWVEEAISISFSCSNLEFSVLIAFEDLAIMVHPFNVWGQPFWRGYLFGLCFGVGLFFFGLVFYCWIVRCIIWLLLDFVGSLDVWMARCRMFDFWLMFRWFVLIPGWSSSFGLLVPWLICFGSVDCLVR